MSVALDLADIQGNILNAYGKQGFPKGRNILLNVRKADAGRALIMTLLPRVTSALRWSTKKIAGEGPQPHRPQVTLNIAFTSVGLMCLDLPTRTLAMMPDEFLDGMAKRAYILGDNFDRNAPDHWDPVWQHETSPVADPLRVHILLTLNAQMTPTGDPVPELDQLTNIILDLCEKSDGGVDVLSGHRGAESRWQELSAIIADLGNGPQPLPTEHFGFTDGISDPVFEGQFPDKTADQRVIGNGKMSSDGVWKPIATGEFLLGYPDEAQEIGGRAMPPSFSTNGTFFAYRKLHQNVVAWQTYMAKTASQFGAVFGIADPAEAEALLVAKFAGRWSDGVPLALAPDVTSWKTFNANFPDSDWKRRNEAMADFTYQNDPDGIRCPMGSHLRRANPRDMLDPLAQPPGSKLHSKTVLNNRRRILRRGLPYGDVPQGGAGDSDEHGIIMYNTCASLFRQYEFVQQQWLNYGLDFNLGNTACPLVGNHGKDTRFVIAADPKAGHAPFIADRPPQFVELRGGGYFFTPSLTALRMIGMGVVDPT